MKILVSTLSYDGKISGFSVDMFVRMFKSFQKQYDIAFNKHSTGRPYGLDDLKTKGPSTLQTGGPTIDFFRPKNDLTNRARVQIINKAVREGYDYLLTIDEDNPISSICLIHMLKTMKEVRAGVVCSAVPSRIPVPYPGVTGGKHPKTGKLEPIIAAVNQSREGGYKHYLPLREIPANKYHEVSSCGTGCVLFDTRYLEKLINKYGQYCCEFDTRRHLDIGNGKYTEIVTLDDGDDYVISIDEQNQKILTKIDSEMIPNTHKLVTPIGEDVLLVERIKQLGAKIIMDCHITAKHRNEGSGFSNIGIGLMELPLEIFIPVYNVTQKIRKCIKDNLYLWRDLFEYNNLMVTFIHDGPISEKEKSKFSDRLHKEFPKRREKGRIRVITYPQNKGVNYARNFAAQSKAMNVLILNDDCVISGNSLKVMMQTLIENKEIGVISPMTKDKNTPNGDGMKFGNVAGRCFMMPTAVCSLVMPIDARINLWYGDDWCFHSIKELGLEIAYAKGAVCEHLGSTTVGKPGKINKGIAKIIEKDKIGRKQIIKEKGWIDKRFT